MSKILTTALMATVLAAAVVPFGIASATPNDRNSDQSQLSGKQKTEASGKQKTRPSGKQAGKDRKFWEKVQRDSN